jgi:hypothetical protein
VAAFASSSVPAILLRDGQQCLCVDISGRAARDDGEAPLNPAVRLSDRRIRAADPVFGVLANFVEASAGDGILGRLGVTDGIVDPSGQRMCE